MTTAPPCSSALSNALRLANSAARSTQTFPRSCISGPSNAADAPLCNTLAACVPVLCSAAGTTPSQSCAGALTALTCPQLQAFAAQARAQPNGAAYVNSACGALRDAAARLSDSNGNAAQQGAALLDWYTRTLAPCASQICASSANPVSAQQLQSVPNALATALIGRTLGKPQLFLLQYGVAILLVLLAVIAVLLFATFWPRQPCALVYSA